MQAVMVVLLIVFVLTCIVGTVVRGLFLRHDSAFKSPSRNMTVDELEAEEQQNAIEYCFCQACGKGVSGCAPDCYCWHVWNGLGP